MIALRDRRRRDSVVFVAVGVVGLIVVALIVWNRVRADDLPLEWLVLYCVLAVSFAVNLVRGLRGLRG
jgi:uncharacterized protein (DUF983 family)